MIRKTLTLLIISFMLLGSAHALDRAPDFRIKDVNTGEVHNLSDFRGKIVLLDFMTLSCPTCEHLESTLREVWPEYKENVVFVTVDVDAESPSLTAEKIESELKSRDIPWVVCYAGFEVGKKYDIPKLQTPTVYLIDREGYVIERKSGDIPEGEIKNLLDSAIEGNLQRKDISPVSIYAMAAVMGIASFFSPCAFPMLPGYMAYYFGIGKEEERKYRKAAIGGVSAGLGIVLVYLLIGILLLYAGIAASDFIPQMGLIVGILLILFGLLMFTPLQYDRIFAPLSRFGKGVEGKKSFTFKLFVYGIGYGAAAAGCTAPLFFGVVFGSIITGSLMEGILSLLIYSAVAGSLMLLVTLGMAAAEQRLINVLKQNTERIKIGSALVLMLVGAYLIWYHL